MSTRQLLKIIFSKILMIALISLFLLGFVKNGFTAICPSSINFGETIQCSIDAAGEKDSYTFSGNANDKVIIRMSHTSGSVNPNIEIRLGGPDGTKLCEAWGGSSAEIASYSLPSSGTYTIVASDHWGTYSGNYNLYLGYYSAGVLEVTPGDGLVSLGTQGGPFSPSSKLYTLKNIGNESINWTASNTQTWISLSATSGTLSSGGSTTVTVSINNNANSLIPSLYSDTISFTNTTNGNGNTTRLVSLTVTGGTSPLTITTTSLPSGTVGITYSANLSATGGKTPYSWSVVSGTLPPGLSLNTSGIISGTPSAAGTYNFTVQVKDSSSPQQTATKDLSIVINQPTSGALQVLPSDGFTSSGFEGGPFSPSSKTYTLSNTGGASINWTASKTQNYVSLSATSGTLTGGASTSVTVSINTNANSLILGSHSDTVTFINTTNGSGNTTRSVSLTVRASGQIIPLTLGTSEIISVQYNQPAFLETVVPEGIANLFILLQKDTSWCGTLEVYKNDVLMNKTSGCNDFAIQINALAPGTYITKLSGSGSGVVTALTSLRELNLGEWNVGTILRQWGSVWYQINVPSGQSLLSVSVKTLGIWSKLEVFYGALGSTQKWSATGDWMNLEINSPPAGMYYVHLTDSAWVQGTDQGRDHLIKADVKPIEPPPATEPVITNISPTKGGNTGPVTIIINGAQLDLNATVWLSRIGENGIVTKSVSGTTDKKSLTAVFDLSGANPGEWTITVQNPDMKTATSPVPFTIESGGEAKLWVEIVGREQIRLGRKTSYCIRFGNSDTVDFYDAVLLIRFPRGVLPHIDRQSLYREYSESIDWNQVPEGIEADNQLIIPVWLLTVPAGGKRELNLELEVPPNSPSLFIGDHIDIAAEIIPTPRSRFSQTGDIAYIDESQVFQSIRNASVSLLQKNGYSEDALERFVQELKRPLRRLFISGIASIGCSLVAIAAAESGLPGLSALVTVACVASATDVYCAVRDLLKAAADLISAQVVTSISPEDKYGPSGYDPEGTSPEKLKRYIPVDRPLTYKIDFWNKEDAPAPTQDVIITDKLDANLEWSTFSFTEFGFLKWKVPLEGGQYFNVDVDLRPDNNLIVNVEGTFNPDTGEIHWEFHSLDPLTNDPPEDPMAGFLPPITDTGYEIGWVTFSVSPIQGLPTGSQITNQAWVKFDVDVFKPAPPNPDSEIPGYGPYLNTIDAGAPTSNILPLPSTQTVTNFTVSWSGSDDAGGSGIKNYDIYLSDNGSPYVLWKTTSETSATFTGQYGHRYSFYSRARDNVGNIEDIPAQADATTTVNLVVNQYLLTISKTGTGNGVITSSPSGINCGSDCSETYPTSTKPKKVTLKAKADITSYFAGWDGACTGTKPTCTVTMDSDKNVTATFNPNPIITLTKSGDGKGTIKSLPKGIDCGNDCTTANAQFKYKLKVTLTAKTDLYSTFLGWGGACQARGTKPTCTITMDSDKNITASFWNPDISVSPTSYDFGSLKVKQSSNPVPFTIYNNGTGNLKIKTMKIIGTDAKMFKINGSTKKTIPSGGNYQFTVTFKPTSIGLKTATLQITSNDPDTPTGEIPLDGIAEDIDSDGAECEGGPYLCYEASSNGNTAIYISHEECYIPTMITDYCNAASLDNLLSCLSAFLPESISVDDKNRAEEILRKIENCEDKYW